MIDFLKGKVTPKDWLAVVVILGVVAAIVLGFYLVVYKQKADELIAVRSEEERRKVELANAQEIASKIDDLKVEVQKIQVLVDDFEQRLPSSTELRQIISKFEDLAQESELQVELSPGNRLRDQRKETWPYQVTAYGNFHQIASFVNRLERYERYLMISDLKIEEEEAGVSKATFTLSTYVFLEQVSPSPAAAAAEAGA